MPIVSPGKDRDLADGVKALLIRCESVGRSFDSLELAVIGLPPAEQVARRLVELGFRHFDLQLARR